jgi:hypothetical protein
VFLFIYLFIYFLNFFKIFVFPISIRSKGNIATFSTFLSYIHVHTFWNFLLKCLIYRQLRYSLCRFCTDQFIVNEEHFVVKCSFYRHIRSEYFGELFNTNDFNSKTDSEKLVYLINNKSRTLAKYIVKSYLYRRESIYRSTYSYSYDFLQMNLLIYLLTTLCKYLMFIVTYIMEPSLNIFVSFHAYGSQVKVWPKYIFFCFILHC